MSEMQQEETHNPRRGRPPRAEAVAGHRRRRQPGSLNRMAQFKLDIFSPEQLDLERFVYRWVNDEPGKLRMATQMDDYDHVETSEIVGFDVAMSDSESEGRLRMVVGQDKFGGAIYAYLLRKPREFWDEDNEAVVEAREDMMAGRVYRGAANADDETRHGGDDKYYTPTDNQIGGAAQRRRGPVPRRLQKA